MMSRLRHIYLKALLASVAIAAVLSGISVYLDWRASRAIDYVDPTAFVLRQHVLWGLGTVLATAATVLVLLALAASTASLSPPWRWPFRFALFVLSPAIGVLFAATFYGLLTLPPADSSAPEFVTPGKLIATLPSALGIASLLAAWKPRATVTGPA